MEMALASLAMMLLLCVMVFHMSLNWHKNYGHWHGHAGAEHWHYQAVERRIVHEMMVQPSLQGNVMAVVACCCYCYCYCFGHIVEAMVLTMGNARSGQHRFAQGRLGRCEWATMVENLQSACCCLFLITHCFQEWVAMVQLPWQHG